MISLKDVLPMLSYLRTIHLYFPLFITTRLLQIILTSLETIHKWLFQWKINFNSDTTKPAQEDIFSRKTKKLPHLRLVLTNDNVTKSVYQKVSY